MHPYNYRWKTPGNVSLLEQNIAELRTELIKLRHEVSNKEQYIGRLKMLCHERTTRIDNLRATIEDLRAANQKLDAEADHLVQLMQQQS
jgi:chromosome segregation ATPase